MKKVRGHGGCVSVNLLSSSTAAEILSAGVMKHRSFNLELPVTKCQLPGGTTPFVFEEYKNFTGKKYNELCLYICTEEDYYAGCMFRIS